MKRTLLSTGVALTLGLLGGASLGGCGSSTKTVSATNEAPATETSAATTTAKTTTSTATTPTTSTPAQTTTNGGTSAPTTRTAPEPAFAQQETHAEGISAAAALVRARGYTPNDTSEYHPEQTLRVLVGTRTGSQEGFGQQAFFFVGGRYIGTDTKEPSATVKVVAQSDTEVTLSYELYRPGDSLSSPSGGQATVRFQLNNGKLTPVGKIPPANSASGLSRN